MAIWNSVKFDIIKSDLLSRDRCFNCGKIGHLARDCGERRGAGRGRDQPYGGGRRSPPRGRSYSRSPSPRRERSPPRRGASPTNGLRPRSPSPRTSRRSTSPSRRLSPGSPRRTLSPERRD
eukprot:TRINITY_DN171_c0_g1_i1.p2 TRINITY_DN171_c0_g1~~TRINITY_DN171_c0_g1_i1.p2  ORF type:complete len:121 (-),score=34.60 TRINITY_DN171_c0_g1_i1:276-638(-)